MGNFFRLQEIYTTYPYVNLPLVGGLWMIIEVYNELLRLKQVQYRYGPQGNTSELMTRYLKSVLCIAMCAAVALITLLTASL